jgi:hypothetical protein
MSRPRALLKLLNHFFKPLDADRADRFFDRASDLASAKAARP